MGVGDKPTVGIYCASSQSGRAFYADLRTQGYRVHGYVRRTPHAQEFLQAVRKQGGVILERPLNRNHEASHLIPVSEGEIDSDLHRLIWDSDVIIVAEPSHYLLDTIAAMKDAGLDRAGTPLVLAPPRTFAVPYLWRALGTEHPFACFSTCPYSCKAPAPGSAFIKRRKRTWFASLEGRFRRRDLDGLSKLFPQAVWSRTPATTSIGNVGAVLHPTPYIMKYDDIAQARREGRPYSYYLEAIAASPDVDRQLGRIDQARLQIADALGIKTFGLDGNAREQEWQKLMGRLRLREAEAHGNVEQLRHERSHALQTLGTVVVSVPHWLDYTYGVPRIEGETIADAVRRTPTYQNMSVPQRRYVEEDVPSSLVPLMSIAERLGLDTSPFQEVMERYHLLFGTEHRGFWRDLASFSDDFVVDYLLGRHFSVADR